MHRQAQHCELFAPLLIVMQHPHLRISELYKIVLTAPPSLLDITQPAVLPLYSHQEAVIVRCLSSGEPGTKQVTTFRLFRQTEQL